MSSKRNAIKYITYHARELDFRDCVMFQIQLCLWQSMQML